MSKTKSFPEMTVDNEQGKLKVENWWLILYSVKCEWTNQAEGRFLSQSQSLPEIIT